MIDLEPNVTQVARTFDLYALPVYKMKVCKDFFFLKIKNIPEQDSLSKMSYAT